MGTESSKFKQPEIDDRLIYGVGMGCLSQFGFIVLGCVVCVIF